MTACAAPGVARPGPGPDGRSRVKRYPDVNMSERMPHILDRFELGEVTTRETRHWTRWGAEHKALWFNVRVGPSLMWRAVAERVP